MSFTMSGSDRNISRDVPLEALDALYLEKDWGDEEHFGVSVTHETEWCLSLYPSGTLIWENLEDGNHPRHMVNVPKEKVLELWKRLTQGRIEEIDCEPWLQGYY